MINLNLEIAQVGNPILRQQAQLVQDLTDQKLQQLMDTLLTTARDANGVGIAAPQVSQSYRLFVVCSHPNPRYPDAPMMDPTIMINPRIISHNDEIVKGWEGCLSVPGVRGLVPRYKVITVEYLDRYGKLQQQKLKDFVARIFQHELDHLNGILFIDRVDKSEDLVDQESLAAS
ncbi:peptide deformylase [Crocosphaera watsonii WH 8501]|uniref:Peptide deformylase n=6 Tax=Crocosphaera watsonii TaxID=263511 RepID=Q4BXA3_CROWT|nr:MULTISPECIES: peptide deformylase [Crocosphaera]EAM48543.1 Formylmethionine deformylase [Crocosphaera watsonii WH 8501]EHJ14534.1 Peptide deformylase [Crocosphaera watsonii WH 0003]MCH2245085.1 peptide deformylase [Crocosphaera sp.]NQZ63207.1 peptide deformylase [Crocosphaera sp.]CCQ50848.1 Peptide deformylase [Crocosphaera watsonii WH 8502]